MAMEKAMKKQFKIAAFFFLLTVLVGGISVAHACKAEHEDCSTEACCEGLICVEVSPGVFECENEECEDHTDHPCEANVRECCDPLVCSCEDTCKSCSLVYGETCDPEGSECCERRAKCSSSTNKCECAATCKEHCDCCVGAECDGAGNCVCKKKAGDSCDPNSPVYECCDLDCVAIDTNIFECQAGS